MKRIDPKSPPGLLLRVSPSIHLSYQREARLIVFMGAVKADSANRLRTASSAHLGSTHGAEKYCGSKTVIFLFKQFGFRDKNHQFKWRIIETYIENCTWPNNKPCECVVALKRYSHSLSVRTLRNHRSGFVHELIKTAGSQENHWGGEV